MKKNDIAVPIFIFIMCLSSISVIYSQDIFRTQIVEQIARIETRMEPIQTNLSLLQSRASSIETWRDQQEFSLKNIVNEMKMINISIRKIEEKLSIMRGVLLTATVLASCLSFIITVGVTVFISRKKS